MAQLNWEDIITYHDIPYKTSGVFWSPSNKIYVNNHVKNYQIFHDYIINHEKTHYLNYNSDENYIKKILKEILIEWHGGYICTINKELKNEIKKYKNEFLKMNEGNIIKNENTFIDILSETKADYHQLLYSKIVKFFRPDSKYFFILLVIIIFLEIFWLESIGVFNFFN